MSAFLPPEGLSADKYLSTYFSSDGKTSYTLQENDFRALEQNVGPEKLPDAIRETGSGREFETHGRYVVGHKGRRLYIASRGPTEATMVDFLAMTYQEGAGGIFQANGDDVLKGTAFKYCPTTVGSQRAFGPWTIECVTQKLKQTAGDQVEHTEAEAAHCTYRFQTIKLSRPGVKSKELLYVCHYKWPDCSLPAQEDKEAGDYLVRLIDILRDDFKTATGPIVVHCTGGKGRTGVAIALDICASRLLGDFQADVKNTVAVVRQQRPMAVLTRYQYVYIGLALAQLALKRLDRKNLPSVFGKSQNEKKVRAAIEECLKITFLKQAAFMQANKR